LLLATPFDNADTDQLVWFQRKSNLKHLEKQAGKLFFYHSEDDFAVPFEHVMKYKKALPRANFRLMKDRNHFLQEEVPELNSDISNE
jgi:pimeloyl-ACP methyl ester carboxylesterase